MCSCKSFYSWDAIITKHGDKLYLDKRNGGPLDFVTVNENATEPPVDGADNEMTINSPQALAHEATTINRHFKKFANNPLETVQFASANPFSGEQEQPVSPAYRYRQWDLGNMNLVARTRIDSAVFLPTVGTELDQVQESDHLLSNTGLCNLHALNEFDSRAPGSGNALDWRQKLDSQRGAVMATELKNNISKLSRWTTGALLASTDQIRLGFVSRHSTKDRKRHVLLGQSVFKPADLAELINLDITNGWGILKDVADVCFKMTDGKYILVKDPNKPLLRLYQATPGAEPLLEAEQEAILS